MTSREPVLRRELRQAATTRSGGVLGAAVHETKAVARALERYRRERGVRGMLEVAGRAPLWWFRGRKARKAQREYEERELEVDVRLGVETARHVELRYLDVVGPNARHGFAYNASPAARFVGIVSKLGLRHEDFYFIDLGSGKGRVLLLASEFPFRRIVGVEFARELCDLARANVASANSPRQRCFDIVTVHGDAASYEFPPHPSVIYMFNPFGPAVMERMLENLRRSLTEHPRQVVVIYLRSLSPGPFEDWRRAFDSRPFLKPISSGPGYWIYGSGASGQALFVPSPQQSRGVES